MRQTIPLRWPMVFPRTRGLCRLSPVPADGWSFPILSLHSLRRRLDPYPAVPSGCTRPFLPHRHRPRVTGNTLGEPELSLSCNFSRERYFEAAVIRYLQAPTLARLPDCTYRTTSRRWAAGPFTPRIAGPVTCSPAVASLHVRFRAIDMTGLSPVGLQSYRLLLPALRSSEVDSQRSERLQLPVREIQLRSQQWRLLLDLMEHRPSDAALPAPAAKHLVPVALHGSMHP
jgi:hypothetical protein